MLTSASEGIPPREFPHASEKLRDTPTEDGHAENDVGVMNVAGPGIVQRQDQSRRGEGEETTTNEETNQGA